MGDELKPEKKRSLSDRYKICPKCGQNMTYIYGETFECPNCNAHELSDFGKVKDFLDKNGPQTAIVINMATGVSIEYINQLLREGRIEIPDGSEVYIKCQKCGSDIRYGRFCPDCMAQLTKNIQNVLLLPEVGEKPTAPGKYSGKMHTLGRIKQKNTKGKE